MMHRHRILWLGLVAVALGAGCKKQEAAPEPAAAVPPPAPPPLAVSSVDLGRAVDPGKRVVTPLATFGIRDTIYASVATTGAASSASLVAKWTYETGQLVDSTAVTIAPTGPAVTEFHIIKPTGWPVGKYQVAILLDGSLAAQKEFEVKR